MKKVSAILARKGNTVASVSPQTTVLDALKIMAEKNIGSIVVMENDNYHGVVTERDYSRKVMLRNKHSFDTTVAEIMTINLPFVTPTDSIDHCMELMTKNNIRYMPVFENRILSGIISMSDVVKETIISQRETISHLQTYIQS